MLSPGELLAVLVLFSWKAFAHLAAEHDIQLLLAGNDAKLSKFLKHVPLDLQEKITNLGFVQPEQLPEIYQRADVFVLPSRREGWGVVVNQALFAGLPIIASNTVGSAIDLVEHESNGYICQAGDVSSLRRAMLEFINNPDKVSQFSKDSLELAHTMTPAFGAKKWTSIINKYCTKSAP